MPERTADHSSIFAVIDARRSEAWERVGGIPLPARLLYHLNELGIRKAAIIVRDQTFPVQLEKWQGNIRLRKATVDKDLPTALLVITGTHRQCLYLDAAHLIDPRIVQTLATARVTTIAYKDPQDQQSGAIRAALLLRRDLEQWQNTGAEALNACAAALFPSDIDPYCPENRGPSSPYFLEIRCAEDARKATWKLILSKQKMVMDLPAEFIDPPFENALTWLLCDTPITPNMVTLSGLAIAMGIAWLFWHGYFVAGALGTFVVEILDGVDGKLARTRLQYSKLGAHEDIVDYFYENSWYVALGVGLSHTVSGQLPAVLATILLAADAADNVFYTLADKWHGKSIDLFSPFDAAFRRIAGRRNIYGFMFIIGFIAGYPLKTFAVAALWAAVTAIIHGVRLHQFGKTEERPRERRAEMAG